MSIHQHSKGRVFRDAIQDGQDFHLRFMDGFVLVCAWASSGPEVKAYAQGIITNEMVIHPQFRYVSGKTVDSVWTDGERLLIQFTDGHVLRSSFGRQGPEVEGVDVKVKIESPLAAMLGVGTLN